MNIRDLHRNLKMLDIERLSQDAVDYNKKLIIRLNKEQIDVGITSEGDLIMPDYQFGYALYKKSLSNYKAPYGTPNLEVTGEFKDGFDIEYPSDGEYDIYSRDVKNDILTDRYDDIFGLTKENLEIAKEAVTRKLKELIIIQLNK
jgi:hypothetical protein